MKSMRMIGMIGIIGIHERSSVQGLEKILEEIDAHEIFRKSRKEIWSLSPMIIKNTVLIE